MYNVKFYDFDKLVIFGGGAVLFEKTRDTEKNGVFENGVFRHNMDRLISFSLPEEPKNARKENLFRKDAYFMGYRVDWSAERKTALYIPAALVPVADLGEVVAFGPHNGETNYKHIYKLTFPLGVEYKKQHVEKLLVPGDWKIPADEVAAGWHWSNGLVDHDKSYHLISDFARERGVKENVSKWWKTEETKNELYYDSDYYTRTEKDAARLNREKIADIINECCKSFHASHYDVERLSEKLNIAIK